MQATLVLICLLGSCALMSPCNQSNAGEAGLSYKVDAVSFVAVGPVPPAAGPQPSVHIDTNIKMGGILGGTIKTSAPYSLGITTA